VAERFADFRSALKFMIECMEKDLAGNDAILDDPAYHESVDFVFSNMQAEAPEFAATICDILDKAFPELAAARFCSKDGKKYVPVADIAGALGISEAEVILRSWALKAPAREIRAEEQKG
jgi:hypothetical protein